MLDWEKNRKKIVDQERAIIGVSSMVVLFGMIIDILNVNDISIFLTNDCVDFSLTLLQILATITTLTLSVIALLSGTITDSYMGISVSSYYLEKRPYIFKQKVVIILEFVLLVTSLFVHILGLYNTVLALFLVSLLLIVISILEIWEIFKGKMNTVDEIEKYIIYLFSEGSDFTKNGEAFVEDWKLISSDQSVEEFDRYYKDFVVLIERILKDEKNVKNVNSICSSMALFLLENENNSSRKKGIRFVHNVYHNIWLWISSNKDKHDKIEGELRVFDQVSREYYWAIKSLDAETVEKELEWNSFSELVIRVSSCISFSQASHRSEDASINGISRTFGGYINEQNKKGNLVNNKKWESIINMDYYSGAYGIPEESKDYYKEALALRDFNVCYGYIFSGNLEMIKNAVFLDGLNNIHSLDDWIPLYRTMLIHCFLYYLAFREDTDCIDETLQNDIRELLKDEDVIKSLNHLCYLLIEKNDVLSADIENKLEITLMNYEPFPIHSNFKSIKIDKAVKEYFMCFSLICTRLSFNDEKLYGLFDVDKYSTYLMSSNNNILKKRFEELYSLFSTGNDEKDKQEIRINEMISAFERVVSKKYKDRLLNEAAEKQRQYEINEIQSKSEKRIKDVVLNQFNSYYEEFDFNFKNVKRYRNVNIFGLVDYTGFLMESPGHYYLEYVIGNLTNWILNKLITDFNVKIIKREESFSSDKVFREFIQENKFDTLLGGQRVFNSFDYEDYRTHTDFINTKTCIFIPMANAGIIMQGKAFGVSLDDVAVDIYSPTLDEMTSIIRNEESGIFTYEPTKGLPIEFEEKELREYLHDERKIIKISINASICMKDINEESACVIIQ